MVKRKSDMKIKFDLRPILIAIVLALVWYNTCGCAPAECIDTPHPFEGEAWVLESQCEKLYGSDYELRVCEGESGSECEPLYFFGTEYECPDVNAACCKSRE
jgi:hypothetical protein